MKTLLTFTLLLSSLSSYAIDKMVIGKDNRHQIKERNKQEIHDSIGILVETGKDENCTGTIIGPRHVLTATHCIGSGRNLNFIPGNVKRLPNKLSVLLPKSAIKAKTAIPFPGFSQDTDKETDLSVVIFESDLPGRPVAVSLFQDAGQIVTVAGYPSDKTLGTLWEDSGIIEEDGSYTLDTFGGQSGSAVRNQNNEIIGVHILSNQYYQKNYAMVFKQKHIDFINDVLKKN